MMAAKAPELIPSGIEPVDKLLGGLETGRIYLVHGEASGKSLFGIKFLIEGLKRGENGALVIRYSPEDAVRRFARLGYDCLEDVYSGRLVILEYSTEIIQQIMRLKVLTPVLRELEWLLGETRPRRLVFDPVTYLVAGEQGQLSSRVEEFTSWAQSFGATVTLVANGENDEVVRNITPLVRDSFRFDVKTTGERATRLFVFEKCEDIPDQPIEVNPARGVFLLSRTQKQESQEDSKLPRRSPFTGLDAITNPSELSAKPSTKSDLKAETGRHHAGTEHQVTVDAEKTIGSSDRPNITAPSTLGTFDSKEPSRTGKPSGGVNDARSGSSEEGKFDLLSDLLDDLAGAPSPIDLTALDADFFELEVPEPATEEGTRWVADLRNEGVKTQFSFGGQSSEGKSIDSGSGLIERTSEAGPGPSSQNKDAPERQGRRGSDAKKRIDLDSSISARAVEVLLRPPDVQSSVATSFSSATVAPTHSAEDRSVRPGVNPKDFNVLVINDDPASCRAITQALNEYTLEVVHDGVSGLATLISFKPDLVILDLELPIIDGFRILAHIRASLNMPIIVVSGSHMRASDRLLSTELGADYYMTEPFSPKELKQKARQLIARHRGITSWIVAGSSEERSERPARRGKDKKVSAQPESIGMPGDYFTSYPKFVAEVEMGVKASLEKGYVFSVVGCQIPNMTSDGGRGAIRLLELIRELVRDEDLISTNPWNYIVVLLADAEANGARAFVRRLRESIGKELQVEPSIWMRSFPELDTKVEESGSSSHETKKTGEQPVESISSEPSAPETAVRPDPHGSYIDLLEHL
jgi:CheY-like chemotaxis protein/KaiC/GvpD/RAD55 family RecA-like ATPase